MLNMDCLVDKEHQKEVEILYSDRNWYKRMVNVIQFRYWKVDCGILSRTRKKLKFPLQTKKWDCTNIVSYNQRTVYIYKLNNY